MKAFRFAGRLSVAALAALSTLAPSPRALADGPGGELVRACIASSTNGQTLRNQGKLVAARDEMIACARDACPAIVRSHCARWLTEIDAAIPSVVVRAVDASGADMIGAKLAIDGRAVKLDGQAVRLDPGPHTVAIESDRGARKDERVLLAEGETSRVVTVRFTAPGTVARRDPGAPPEPPPRGRQVPPGAWILGGAGLLSLGAATYFAVAANSDLNQLRATCSPHCSQAQTNPGRTDALVFDVTLGVGAAALAGALVWAIASPSHARAIGGAARQGSAFGAWAARLPRFDVRPVAGGALGALTLAY